MLIGGKRNLYHSKSQKSYNNLDGNHPNLCLRRGAVAEKMEGVLERFYFPRTVAFTLEMIYNHIIWCHIMMDSLKA